MAGSPHAAGRVMTTHGMRGTPTYKSYLSAKARCQNQTMMLTTTTALVASNFVT